MEQMEKWSKPLTLIRLHVLYLISLTRAHGYCRVCHAPRTMPYIYLTALPGDIVKLGRSRHKSRALGAQTYYVPIVRVLALWRTEAPRADERRAQQACAQWHARAELYHVPHDWLDTEHPMVVALRRLFGEPLPECETPQWRPHGGLRIGDWTERGIKRLRWSLPRNVT